MELNKPTTEVKNLFSLNDGRNFIVQGSLSKSITDALNEEYKLQFDEDTGIGLESQVFQTIKAVTDYIATNPEDITGTNPNVGILFAVDNKETINEDLATLSSLIIGMDNSSYRNSALIINKDEESDASTESTIILENYCSMVNLPIYYNLKSFLGARNAY